MRRGRTDYRMQRRAVLAELRNGVRSLDEARDAHPDLLRAATHIGSPAREPCPLCDDTELRLVTYVFDRKAPTNRGGRAVPRESLARQHERYGDLTVYTVEVCTACHWHHLVESFELVTRDTAVG
ncbi:MAG: DUF5318 family protein [Nitriliruptor sp.]